MVVDRKSSKYDQDMHVSYNLIISSFAYAAGHARLCSISPTALCILRMMHFCLHGGLRAIIVFFAFFVAPSQLHLHGADARLPRVADVVKMMFCVTRGLRWLGIGGLVR